MMMRGRLILVGLLIALVLVCGCGEKAQDGDAAPVQTPGDLPEQTAPGDTEPPAIEGISQEDLDALGEGLEGLAFEDLGGLSDS
jgi:hypothetical protein